MQAGDESSIFIRGATDVDPKPTDFADGSISVHTSPLATLGGKDAGGMNVYVRDLAIHVAGPESRSTCSPAEPPRQAPKSNHLRVHRQISMSVQRLRSTRTRFSSSLPPSPKRCVLFALDEGIRYDIVHAHYWLSGLPRILRPYWEAPYVLMFHTTADMKNRGLSGDRSGNAIAGEQNTN